MEILKVDNLQFYQAVSEDDYFEWIITNDDKITVISITPIIYESTYTYTYNRQDELEIKSIKNSIEYFIVFKRI